MDKKGSIISAVLAVGLGCIAVEAIRSIKVIASKAVAEEEAVEVTKAAQRGDLRNSQKDTTGDYKGINGDGQLVATGDYKGINGDGQLVIIFNIGYFGGRRVK